MSPEGSDLRSASSPPSDQQVARWRASRERFGFPGDADTVRRLWETHGVIHRLAVPLSPEEHRQLDERDRVRASLPRVKAAVESLHPDYGGAYTDQRAGGRLILLITRPLSDQEMEKVRAACADPSRVDFRTVAYSKEQLQDAHARVTALLGTEDGAALGLQHLSTDVVGNRVQIGVRRLTPERLRRVRELFPEDVFVVIEAGKEHLLHR